MPTRRIPVTIWAGGTLVLAVAIALRVNAGLFRDLWEDEIIAATHAMQPWWQLPIEVARHDVHPFLYFMQLHLWTLLGTSDLWLKLNSITWNLAAIASIAVVGRRLYDLPTGLVAAALLALAPASVWIAQEVRPYDWLYVLMIWDLDAVERACRTGFRSRSVLLWVLVISVAVIYSHALGFLIVFLFGVYAAVRLLHDGAGPRGYRNWLLLFAGAAVLAAPPLATDLLRDANLGGPDSLSEMALWLPRILLPRGDEPAALLLAATLFLGVVGCGLLIQPTRLMTAVFIVLPLALCALSNAAGAVMFKLNIFSTIVTPFFVLVVARLSLLLRPPLRWAVVCLCAALFTLGSVEYLHNRVPTTGFLAASRLIRAHAQKGDIVYVPQQSMFWGMARYLVGPEWGSALAISGTPNAAWQRMYARLGPRLVRLLYLEPKTQTVMAPDGLELLVGPVSLPQIAGARRVWLITYERADLPSGFPPKVLGTLHEAEVVPVQQLTVALYE